MERGSDCLPVTALSLTSTRRQAKIRETSQVMGLEVLF